jgi:protein-S-isoprenylcysteine O-methyltransferase Ste14
VNPPPEVTAKADHAGVPIFPPLLLAICAACGALTAWWVSPAAIPALVSYAMAALCLGTGLFLDQWAQRTLRQSQTAVHPAEATSSIVASGAFGWSRNPIYLGQGLLLAAGGFLMCSYSYFWVLLPWWAVMRFGVIAAEERYLLRKFGQPYMHYRNTVRRWL